MELIAFSVSLKRTLTDNHQVHSCFWSLAYLQTLSLKDLSRVVAGMVVLLRLGAICSLPLLRETFPLSHTMLEMEYKVYSVVSTAFASFSCFLLSLCFVFGPSLIFKTARRLSLSFSINNTSLSPPVVVSPDQEMVGRGFPLRSVLQSRVAAPPSTTATVPDSCQYWLNCL